jgi:hypothetical protein
MHTEIARLGKQAESIEAHERVMTSMTESRGTVAGRADSHEHRSGEARAQAEKVDAAFDVYLRYRLGGVERRSSAR